MAFILLGIGVGCWMYSFVNHRWNNDSWISSTPFFWIGLLAVLTGIGLLITQ